MDERFNIFVTRVLEAEGYLSDDVNDNGGLTKYGISQRAYPNLDIKNITLDDAKNIYYNDYFLKYRFNEVENDNIAFELFDTSVNMGGKVAVTFIQETINFLKIDNVLVDGIIGNVTINAINSASDNRHVLNFYLVKKALRYHKICENNPDQIKFLRGWIIQRVLKHFI